MIIINYISFMSGYTTIFSYNLPSSDIIYRINFLLYNESKIDIWNINTNINVSDYDKVVV